MTGQPYGQMAFVSNSSLRNLHRFLQDAGSVRDVAEFAHYVVEGLSRVVACDVVGYNEVDPVGRRLIVVGHPPDALTPEVEATFGRFVDQHPLINHQLRTGDRSAHTLSDFVTRVQLHRLDLYQHGFKPIGAEYQIAFGIPCPPPRLIGTAPKRRRRDFSAGDRLLLDLAAPSLAHVYEKLRMREQLHVALAALETNGQQEQSVVLLDGEMRIELMTPAAERWLESCCDWPRAVRALVPAALRPWAEQQRDRAAGRTGGADDAPFILQRPDGGNLIVRYLPRDAQTGVLLLEWRRPVLSAAALQRLGLTAREAEVMEHVTRGKSNAEVAHALGVSMRTVQKHLEHVFAKLNVYSRTAAVAWALERTRPEGLPTA